MQKQLLISLGILLFLCIGTFIVIIYAKGYQIDLKSGKPVIAGTGLLVTTSTPDGAEVFINDHLTTATNNTINLAPNTYTVQIFKEGYFPWKKTITVQKEVVSKADALLLPNAPKLESVTSVGVTNPIMDPSGTKIAFTVASGSAKKNGVYILNMNATQILTLQSASTQIVDDSTDLFSTSQLQWAPDGTTLLATITNSSRTTVYQLSTNGFNQSPTDVTETLPSILASWNQATTEKTNSLLGTLNTKLKQIVSENFHILSWSIDETKILYNASSSATLPKIIRPPLIGTNSTPEERTIEAGKVYVYDIKEDKNFKILDTKTTTPIESGQSHELPLRWLPDSKHLLLVHDKKIDVLEYDGGNKTTVFAGPFVDSFAFPWPGNSKFVMLTNLGNQDSIPNLYTVSLQ